MIKFILQVQVLTALTLLLLVNKFSLVQSQCLTENDSPQTMRPYAIEHLSDSRFDFALESLKKIADIETQDNIFFSPHSLYEALSVAYFGSRGETERALKKALHVPDDFTKIDVQRFYTFEKAMMLERKVSF